MYLKIAHLTSVHSRVDTRIFHKMCKSLQKHGADVQLVVADGLGDELTAGIRVHDVGASHGRLDRVAKAPRRVYQAALKAAADLYHLHDPELIPIGLHLLRQGKRVVFDFHEDVPKQLLGKPYLNKPMLWTLSQAFAALERWAVPKFTGIVAATPYIRDKFLPLNPRTIDINNYPLLGELDAQVTWDEKQLEVCYVGGISRIRGIREVVQAMGQVQSPVSLNLCGRFSEPAVEQACQADPGWSRVNAMGFVDRAGVREVLGRSVAGIVTFHPLPNHIDAQPNKMFEYMAAGIPVIASDFPLWREIVLSNDCGLCVDPLDPAAIARAIDYLVQHPGEARRMGDNGRRAVLQRYNWAVEERKLLHFYDQLLSH